jgi:hypothetical protein
MIESQPHCPLCQGEWKRVPSSPHTFSCPNYSKCHMTLMVEVGGGLFYLRRILIDGTEIWWSGHSFAQFRLANTGFTFDPPFDVSTERLKVMILFS